MSLPNSGWTLLVFWILFVKKKIYNQGPDEEEEEEDSLPSSSSLSRLPSEPL
jgi:hypothetical protein